MVVPHTNSDNAREHVQVAFALLIKEPLHVSVVNEERSLKVWSHTGSKQALSAS